jgi:YD repeat-containing protein
MTYPNGVVADYTYYDDNRLHTLANTRGGMYLSTFNYAYDGNGSIETKLELKGTTSYKYDVVGRLEKETEPSGKVTQYKFDEAGNRKTETVTDNGSVTVTQYSYNIQGRLLDTVETSDDTEKTTNFYYDNNGNQISKLVSTIADADGGEAYSLIQPGTGEGDEITFELDRYNTIGQLISVQNDLCMAASTYNADGLRASKEVTKGGVATTTRFLYEGDLVTLEMNGSGAQTAYNVYGDDSIISRKTAQGTDYYLYNGRGDVVQLAT